VFLLEIGRIPATACVTLTLTIGSSRQKLVRWKIWYFRNACFAVLALKVSKPQHVCLFHLCTLTGFITFLL